MAPESEAERRLEVGEGPVPAVPQAYAAADPAPLGLAAFAMTTFALSVGNANIWGPGADAAIALALVYGGAVQLFAGMWEFVRKNTFGALAFSSYGAFWIAYYVFGKFVAGGVPAGGYTASGGRLPLGMDDLHRLHDRSLHCG